MANDLSTLGGLLGALATTYLVHSTLLIIAAWFAVRVLRTNSPTLRERLWKGAAVAGLLTASLQFSLNSEHSVFVIPLVSPAEGAEQPANVDDCAMLGAAAFNRPPASVAEKKLKNNASLNGVARDRSTPPNADSGSIDHTPYSSNKSFKPPAVSEPDESNFSPVRSIPPSAPLAIEPPERVAPLLAETLDRDESYNSQSGKRRTEHAERNGESAATKRNGENSSVGSPFSIFRGSSFELHLPSAAALMVLLCALLGSVRLTVHSLVFHCRVRRCRPIETGTARHTLDELTARFGIRRHVTILSADEGTEPAAFGLFRWRILMPPRVSDRLTYDELTALLAHELAHLVRNDAWWLLFGRILCSFAGFQPLNFLARREWQLAAEWQCDEWALERQVDPFALARCLTRVAEWRVASPMLTTSLGAVGSQPQLTGRIERLLEQPHVCDPWRRGLRRWMSAAIVFGAACALGWFGPRATLSAPVESRSPADREAHNAEGDLRSAETAAQQRQVVSRSPDRDTQPTADPPLPEILAAEQKTLQRELQALEAEIASLHQLMSHGDAPPPASVLLEQLQARTRVLRSRAQFLDDNQPHPSETPVDHQ